MKNSSVKNTALVDTHCHLDFPVFDNDRAHILQQCHELNIAAIVVPGAGRKDWQRLLRLCQQHEMLFPALGLHPYFVHEHQMEDLHVLAQLCQTEPLVAIGEIGLDYYSVEKSSVGNDSNDLMREMQGQYFSEQLQIARQYQLPVLIHARKSHDEVLRCLKSVQPGKGIIHAFSGSYEQAKEYLKLGFKLGFGGAFTYPKATRLRSLVSRLPLEAWVLETDAPDMSPVNHHGHRNSPAYLNEIAQVFVNLYSDNMGSNNKDADRLLSQLHQNTHDIFPVL